MIPPTIPQNETLRTAALRSLKLLYTPAEERFDRITRLAAYAFRIPIALITFVDTNVQWFKSKQGLQVCETDRKVSFCGHAILGEDVFVVEDAREDERFKDNPLVTGNPNIRFYAGMPIKTPDDMRVGTLCLIDHEKRTLAPPEIEILKDLGKIVEVELRLVTSLDLQTKLVSERDEFKRKALLCPVTGVWKREALGYLLRKTVDECRQHGQPVAIILCQVERLAELNARRGYGAGDAFLSEIAQRLRRGLPEGAILGRFSGLSFMILCRNSDSVTVMRDALRIRAGVVDNPVFINNSPIAVVLDFGVASLNVHHRLASAQSLLRAAVHSLRQAMAQGGIQLTSV